MKRLIIPFSLVLMATTIFAQNGNNGRHEKQRIKQYLSGKLLEISYRDGGPIYGRTYLREVHLCSSGQYVEYGFSQKQSISSWSDRDYLDENSWTDYGTWDVILISGRVFLKSYSYSSGKQSAAPIHIRPDGRISVDADYKVSIRIKGRTQCQ